MPEKFVISQNKRNIWGVFPGGKFKFNKIIIFIFLMNKPKKDPLFKEQKIVYCNCFKTHFVSFLYNEVNQIG